MHQQGFQLMYYDNTHGPKLQHILCHLRILVELTIYALCLDKYNYTTIFTLIRIITSILCSWFCKRGVRVTFQWRQSHVQLSIDCILLATIMNSKQCGTFSAIEQRQQYIYPLQKKNSSFFFDRIINLYHILPEHVFHLCVLS